MYANSFPQESAKIRELLENWAAATRQNRAADVLANHANDALIYDVLPPLRYESAAAYRKSWGDWQPATQGDGTFELVDLAINAGPTVGFAHALIRCGGTLPDGKTFEDLVRATFCLGKAQGTWMVQHQHISKPWKSL